MTDDYAAMLKEEWDKHQDWHKLGEFVSSLRIQSYQAGIRDMQKLRGVEALKALVVALN